MTPKTTPKDFFLWAGAMITLYASVVALLALIFAYLNYVFPDPLGYFPSDPYSSGISYEMASLIVLFPLFLVIMRFIRKDMGADPTRADIWVRRWALYLTLFVAGATVAGDLITLIMYFFNGDVTLRFGLKVLVILLIAGAGFLHFLADLRGYWAANPQYARMVGWGVGAVILCTIVAGFVIIGTPWQARQSRFDEQRVSDLSQIQSEITSYWQAKQALPQSLSELSDATRGVMVPVDPQTGGSYEYRASGPQSFELCATFNAPSRAQTMNSRSAPYMQIDSGKGMKNSWQHGGGRTCFGRIIDPAFYPPLRTSDTARPAVPPVPTGL